MRESIIGKPKKQAILSTQDTERRQINKNETTQKTKNDEQLRPTQNIGVNLCCREW